MVRVLIVEDDADIRDFLCEVIHDYLVDKALEAEIEAATNGLDGLRKLKGLRYDLIFTDLRMPLLTGLEMLRQNRYSDGPNIKTPVVLITGNHHDTLDDWGNLHEELEDSVVLEKPLLLRAVYRCLEKFLLSKT